MLRVVVPRFGDEEVLELTEEPAPEPGADEVLVRLLSVGMNHADLMARRGEYKLSSGEPPFTPGLEGGGVIEAVGAGVTARKVGQRVILGANLRLRRADGSGVASLDGTYRTHFMVPAEETIAAPDELPDVQLGALWLTYLTAWGCLVWKQKVRAGQVIGIPAASSGVGWAAAQVARKAGAKTIGLTTSAGKAEKLKAMPKQAFDEIIVTSGEDGSGRAWHRDLLKLTDGRGVDVFFDPVAAGAYLNTEIRALAMDGTIWVYGLLGEPGVVDVSPLIRKHAAIRGWLVGDLVKTGGADLLRGYQEILNGFVSGEYSQPIAVEFPLRDVRQAHEFMARGEHIGKIVLRPDL